MVGTPAFCRFVAQMYSFLRTRQPPLPYGSQKVVLKLAHMDVKRYFSPSRVGVPLRIGPAPVVRAGGCGEGRPGGGPLARRQHVATPRARCRAIPSPGAADSDLRSRRIAERGIAPLFLRLPRGGTMLIGRQRCGPSRFCRVDGGWPEGTRQGESFASVLVDAGRHLPVCSRLQ